MVLTVIGNACLAFSLLLFLYPILPLLATQSPRGGDALAELATSLSILLIPMWLLLTGALGVGTARGGLDWLPIGRGTQYAFVIAASLSMGVVSWFSGALRSEPIEQIPWAVRPMMGWAVYLLPMVAMGAALVTVNPSLGEAVPAVAIRFSLVFAGGLSLVLCGGLLLQGLSMWSERNAAQVEHEISRQSERDQRYLEEVRRMDPQRDFPNLLNHTSEFESPPIRKLALEKVLAHPHFTEELTDSIRNGWADYALRFLESNDPPNGQVLAEPVREALLQEAEWVRGLIRREHTLRDDDFDYRATRLLKVVERFRTYGVDYAPAVRAFRQALDEPRDLAKGHNRVNPTCRRMLDDWLKKASRTSG